MYKCVCMKVYNIVGLQEGDILSVARPDGGLGGHQPHLPAERQGRQVRGIQVRT